MTLLFIPYRNPDGTLQPIYTLGWTLNYEMFFYLLFALGLSLRSRFGGPLAIVALLSALVAAGNLIAEPPGMASIALVAYFFTRPILMYFVLGMVLGLVFLRVRERRVTVAPGWLCLGGGIALAVALSGGPLVSFPAVGVAIAIATLFRERQGTAPRFERLAQAFGDASYSMYLTHSFVLGAFAAVTARFVAMGEIGLGAMILAGCAACFAVSWVVWRTVEVPLTNRLRGKGRRGAQA
jgi:peptidoglycan/LPS O-acetylase OafA/YrhL